MLLEHQLDPKSGVLVQFAQVTEQDGEWFSGLWLNASKQFWCFEVLIARTANAVPEIERFENVTHETPVLIHVPGTGKSFGAIAIEVLESRFEF